MDVSVLLWVLAIALMVAGLFGLFLPALPGAPLLFAGMLVGAWADGFVHVGAGMLVVLGILAALSYAADFAAGAWGARRFGASKRSALGAAIGAVVGLFFGVPGLLLGPFVGAVVGELTVRRDLPAAGRAGVGATLGLVIGAAAKAALFFCMAALFTAAFFF